MGAALRSCPFVVGSFLLAVQGSSPHSAPDQYPLRKDRSKGTGRAVSGSRLTSPVEAATAGPGGAERPFVYNHVAKTGGSFVKNVLTELFGSEATILQEWHGLKALPLPTTGPQRPFVLGAMRHPCDYYVSLWAFSSAGPIDQVVKSLPSLREHLGRDAASNLTSAIDVRRFRKWVRQLSAPEFNLLSTRFWFSYFKERNPCQPFRGDVCVGKEGKYVGMADEMRSDLRAMNVSSLADCWIETNNLEDDFEACLRQYEQDAGVHIDWTKYAELKRTRYRNRSTRGRCQEYYDEATMKFVMEKDKLIVEKFGYKTCCPEQQQGARKDEL